MNFIEYNTPISSFLKLEDGHTIEKVLMTTYTLSKRILADIILNLVSGQRDLSGCFELQKRIELESGVNNWGEKISIYAHEVLENETDRAHAGLDEYISSIRNKLVKMVKRENSCFHPKIVLIAEKDAENNISYKLMVSSKNLTYDNFFQSGIIMTGISSDPKESDTQQPNGAKLLEFIRSFNKDEPSKWEELRYVDFKLNGKSVDFKYTCPADNRSSLKSALQEDDKLSSLKSALQEDMENAESVIIITDSLGLPNWRKTLSLCDDKDFDNKFKIVSNTKSWFNLLKKNSEQGICFKDEDIKGNYYITIDLEYIHSKLYLIRKGKKLIAYIGSANCTSQALEDNYEFMVRLEDEIKEEIKISEDNVIGCIGTGEEEKKIRIKAITKEDLEKYIKTNAIEEYMEGFELKLNWQSNKMTVKYSNKKQKPDDIKTIYLCPPNIGKKIVLDSNNDTCSYACSNTQCPDIVSPHMQLYANGEYYSVECNWENTPSKDNDDPDYSTNLYKLFIPRIKDIIPPCGKKGFYNSDDTDEIRIAKFMSVEKENAVAQINERIGMVMKKLENHTANEEDMEEEYIDSVDYNNQMEAAKKRIDGLKSVLGITVNEGNKNEQ